MVSAEIFHVQTAAFNDAFQSADGNRFAAVHRDDDLPSVFTPPFLMAAGLRHEGKSVFPQNFYNFLRVANGESPAHATASSSNFAPLFNLTGAGSNQSSIASFALAMASASVSPAEAQP